MGYERDEIVGVPVTALAPPGRKDECGEVVARLRRGESIDGIEIELLRKDGACVPVLLFATHLRDASGEFLGFAASCVDIFRIKEREEHIKFLLDEVSHRAKDTSPSYVDGASYPIGRLSRNIRRAALRIASHPSPIIMICWFAMSGAASISPNSCARSSSIFRPRGQLESWSRALRSS